MKQNTSLLCFDFSYNENFDDNLIYHKTITESILESADEHSQIQKIHITSSAIEVKAHYLEVIEEKQGLYVYVNEKILEDVDIQE